jgi:[ribosomal protein S5]-alanine N-acetyltransferase
VIIKTKRLVLREVKASDFNALYQDMNNIKISSCLLGVPHPFKKIHAKQWIKHCAKTSKQKPRTEYVLAITFKNENKMIGEVILNETDFEQKKSELAFWLSESHWQKGIITEAVKAVIDFAFNKLKLNRLEISAFAENEPSNNLAKKLGFKFEGTKREVSIPESTKKVHDDHIYSLLKKEYEKAIPPKI